MFDFQNVGIKIFVWTVANKNKYQKNYLGGCEGLSPLKPQSHPKMVFLTASSHLSYGNNIEKSIWDIFSTISDHFKNHQIIPPPSSRNISVSELQLVVTHGVGDVGHQKSP